MYGGAKRRQFCLQSFGTKVTLHTIPTLQNNEPIPQVLKQVVNLSCLYSQIFRELFNKKYIITDLIDQTLGFKNNETNII